MVATPELVQRKARDTTARPGHQGLDGKNDTRRTRVIFETETEKKITLLPPALSLKEVRFLWRMSCLRSASKRERRAANGPWPYWFNEQTPARTVCTPKRTCIYVVYIYKDITDATRRQISFLAFLGVTEGLADGCVCTDCSANRFKCFGVLLMLMRGGGLNFYIRVIVLNWTVWSF